ncbi:MAG: hypothetical protein AAFX06_18625 [Planctomycetota bacterium]
MLAGSTLAVLGAAFRTRSTVFCVLIAAAVAFRMGVASACPFCSALQPTLSDDLEQCTAAVLARCESVTERDGFHLLKLRLESVVRGDGDHRGKVLFVESTQPVANGGLVLLFGFGDPLQWDPPREITREAVDYIGQLQTLPASGPQRLAYFLQQLRHRDPVVSQDAYNEFAEATMEDITGLQKYLDREWVLDQLRDASTPVHRRRLCWTFLSQCGTSADLVLFEELIQQRVNDPTAEFGMDAAIACYIALGGEKALARIERDYLANKEASYSDSFAAVSAIRVHGSDLNCIPKPRLSAALRLVLNRPELADLVIADLARWEDWSAIDQMVQLFETDLQKSNLVKPAVVLYLKTCPTPKGAEALDRLRLVDAEAVRFAEASMRMYPGLPSIPVPPPE